MPLKHAHALEPIDEQPLHERLEQSVSTIWIKSRMLQLMRVVLRAGEHLNEHHVRGEITLQCLEGQARIDTPGNLITLSPGQLVLLPSRRSACRAGAERHAGRRTGLSRASRA